jgi:hypothetical protein
MDDKPLLDAYRFGTFCKRHELTPAHLKTLMRRGLGPEVMDLGTAQRISREGRRTLAPGARGRSTSDPAGGLMDPPPSGSWRLD